MESSEQKLSNSEKFGYGLGDCAANFVFQTQLIFLMSYYTDVLGITLASAASIFLFSRLWDAVNDPLIGALADRTETRWGKFRPWVLFTAVPFAVCFVLAYTTPDLSPVGKVIWAAVTYNLLMMVYTANNIPYAALTGVITSDPVQRTSLTSWRFFLAMTAGFLVQTLTPDLVEWFGRGDQARGYQMTMSLWAVIAVVFFVVTFATTKERVRVPVTSRSSVATDLTDLLRNRTWIALATLTLFYFIYLSMRGSIGAYYFQYVVDQQKVLGGRMTTFGFFNGAGVLSALGGILLSKPLSSRFGKRDVYRVVLLICAILTAAFYFLPGSATWGIVGTQCVLQFFYGISIPLTWAMMADVADQWELKTGRRATAMTFAATVFALKLGLSIGGASALWLLDWYGYAPNVPQTQSATQGIRLMMSIFPAIAFLLAGIALGWYEIDAASERSMSHSLDKRRAESAAT